MKLLWTLLKVALVLALAIPVTMFLLGTALSVLGGLFVLSIALLRIAIIGAVVYGAYRLVRWFVRGSSTRAEPPVVVRELPRPDPYYESAMRELDREMGTQK